MSVAQPPPPRLQMRGITKRYPGVVANNKIDLDVKAGEILAQLDAGTDFGNLARQYSQD